jgi:hypothetical protein
MIGTKTPTVSAGYDVSSDLPTDDFPSEPAGWGQPGQVRHAENIGHGVWVAEHPIRPGADGLDPTPVDDLETWHATHDPGGRVDQLIEKHFGAASMCPIHDCIRPDHAMFEPCEDAVGHTWFQGDPDHYDPAGGIQL